MIEVELPDGTVLEFPEGTSQDVIRQTAKKYMAGPTVANQDAALDPERRAFMEARARGEFPAPVPVSDEAAARADAMSADAEQSMRASGYGAMPQVGQGTAMGLAGQFGAGSQSGIANALGFPVDALTGAMNATGLTDIQKPVLGSEQISEMLQPFRAGIPEPQTGLERGARRVGEEIGASATMLPLAFASPAVRARPMASAAVEAASATGSGVGAATANEIAPDSAFADIVGALVGGLPAGAAASRAANLGFDPAVIRGGIDEQRQIARDAYGTVRADTRVLPQDSVDNMALGISSRMDAEKLYPELHPGSRAILDVILRDSADPMRIEDVENLRRVTQQGLPATASPADRRLSTIMTDEITAYLDGLNDPVADELRTGRAAHRRGLAATAVDDAATRAQRRASTTGSGGNEINATRQNIARIIENPRRARSFTPDELAQMDEVAQGTTGQNAARRLSRFAPSSGGLSAMLGIGGAMASPAVALPIMAATEGAKFIGERSTRKSIEALLQSLAPDRVLKPSESGISNVIRALMAGRSIANQE